MVCPNCGNDCADAKFCPECGEDLQGKSAAQSFAERRRSLRAMGQAYCPNCLSTSIAISNHYMYYRSNTPVRSIAAMVIELSGRLFMLLYHRKNGDKCACLNCGEEWYSKRFALQESHRECVEKILADHSSVRYPGLDGSSLVIDSSQITITLSDKRRYLIPYKNLSAVSHCEGAWAKNGSFSLRDKAHRLIPLPKTVKAAEKDRFTIFYDPGYLIGYKQLETVLKEIIAQNKDAQQL